jgi:hypothetical protein
MSKLRELHPRVLIEIASTLMSSENFGFEDPYDDYESNLEKVRDVSKWAAVGVEYLDLEFICAFIIENQPLLEQVINQESTVKDIINVLKIPTLKKYEVYYEIWGSATLTEKYRTKWESFSRDWAQTSVRQSYYDGEFNYYEGDYLEHDSDNFEPDNFDITYVRRLDESKKTILSKIVVENTTEVLDNLDKQTLIELRNIINRKLSSF